MNRTKFFSAVLLIFTVHCIFSQQDPQFTQFFNNRLQYNPGYAGTSNAICGVAHFRKMWMAFDGAPLSINATFDMKFKELPLGVGLNIMSDKIGPMNTFLLRVPASYILKLGGGNLGVGLELGVMQKKITADWLPPDQYLYDNAIPGNYGLSTNPDINKLTYDVGFGVFYNLPKKFYVGLSSIHLPAQVIKQSDSVQYRITRHYYFMAGYNFALDPRNQLIPNIKVRSDVSAMSIDANLLYMWNDALIIGAGYRNQDAAMAILGYNHTLPNGSVARLGISYDLPISKIKGHTPGSAEITLGYCMPVKVKKITTYGDDLFFN